MVDGVPEAADWEVTRKTKLAEGKNGVMDPLSVDLRCHSDARAPGVATVPAGAVVYYLATAQINHAGPTQYYMAKVPEGQSAKDWDGDGIVWFKIFHDEPAMKPGHGLVWSSQGECMCACG